MSAYWFWSASTAACTVTARRALQMSLNVPAVELLSEVGTARFLARLRQAGLKVFETFLNTALVPTFLTLPLILTVAAYFQAPAWAYPLMLGTVQAALPSK